MRPLFPLIALIIFGMVACGESDSGKSDAAIDTLLQQLDDVIAQRDQYTHVKEQRIDSLRQLCSKATTAAERFDLLGHLYDEYRSYNTDSALAICERRQAIAPTTERPYDRIHADLNLAEQLGFTTMYGEARAIIEPLTSADVPDYLVPYLFHLKRTIYGLLSDYSLLESDRNHYAELTATYRDSLLAVNEPGTLIYHLVLSDKMNAEGRYAEAIDQFENYLSDSDISSHEAAIAAYTLSDSYHLMGDRAGEKRQLIISSISDMESAVKEYLSLRSLALLLYQEGDVNRAYKYLKLCMQDAQECNARQRVVEINSILPVVNDVYLATIATEQERLAKAIIALCVLLVFLIVACLMIYKQMKRISQVRSRVEDMNDRLTTLNEELQTSNQRLVDANRAIAENSCLKEEYIARYMDQCLGYIDKLDTYRKSLNKLALAGRLDQIKQMTKSVSSIDSELKAFYDNFDETFLRLFPNFVSEFNALLRADEQIVPKGGARLNTELRIFALIRLGINDSVQIAKFLRYSTTTIYNYRTRVRNRAAVPRERLEIELMKIGSASEKP